MSCPKFIADSFAIRTATHLAHLSATSYADHMALGEFYDGLLGLVDEYAEIYMGLEKRITRFPKAEVPDDEPVQMLRDYLKLVTEEAAEDHDSEALKNVLAEIEALTARTIYKLVNLK
jgi:hypothetical protein